MRFVWDEKKAAENIRKHQLPFEAAIDVFDDPLAVRVKDRMVDGEQRWHMIGTIDGRVLV